MNQVRNENPALLLAGGRPIDAGIYAAALSPFLAATPKPVAAYIGAANGDNPAFYALMKSMLLRAGVSKVVFVRLARKKIDAGAVKAALAFADLIFISGGEVEDGMNWLNRHGLTAFLKSLYREGKQFLCVSAGTIMMGARWVRWDDPGNDDTAELFDCLGIIPVVFDTHAEDEDWIELKTVLRLTGDGARGYGIPRGGAIRADSKGTLVNLKESYLTFINENGNCRIAEE